MGVPTGAIIACCKNNGAAGCSGSKVYVNAYVTTNGSLEIDTAHDTLVDTYTSLGYTVQDAGVISDITEFRLLFISIDAAIPDLTGFCGRIVIVGEIDANFSDGNSTMNSALTTEGVSLQFGTTDSAIDFTGSINDWESGPFTPSGSPELHSSGGVDVSGGTDVLRYEDGDAAGLASVQYEDVGDVSWLIVGDGVNHFNDGVTNPALEDFCSLLYTASLPLE